MAIFPNCAVTFGKGWRVTLLLLLATVFKQGHSQITCTIEIDSLQGLWRETTPMTSNSAQYCSNYKYIDIRLRCSAAQCPWASSTNGACTVYNNADTQIPCLATCNGGCIHGFKCLTDEYCPCTYNNTRYEKAKMCVPYSRLLSCPSDYYIRNECAAPPCNVTCPNGWCDNKGYCTCNDGFSKYSKTGMCVPNQCTQACVGGTCHTYGACTCQDDSVVGPREGYRCPTEVPGEGGLQPYDPCAGIPCDNGKCDQGACKCSDGFSVDANRLNCVPISCPGEDSTKYCRRQCQQSSCQSHGSCDDKGTCNCNDGFKVDTYNGLNCVPINCPDQAYINYCQRICQRTSCKDQGRCVGGTCYCNYGYKKSAGNIYLCEEIQCPSTAYEGVNYCKAQCDVQCHNGQCKDYVGTCTCYSGYKESQNNVYQCDPIQCPATVVEDINYCKTQCDGSCKNGYCNDHGTCTCNFGYKKSQYIKYQCDKIQCPSKTNEDNVYCYTQCDLSCYNGWCSNDGTCTCNGGFKKTPYTLYNCVEIQCPAKTNEDNVYCKAQCDRQRINGQCDYAGTCICNVGYKKKTWNICQCDQIECPSRAIEDNVYCKDQCSGLCKNGQCDFAGTCTCSEGFKKSPNTLYQCDRIFCPSVYKDDVQYCGKQCSQLCHNGTCSYGGTCKCNNGFKKTDGRLYKCNQINCPALVQEDNAYCERKCQTFCMNGICDTLGRCACNTGFTKDPNKNYKCVKITCPSTAENERGFCKGVCESQCDEGACDEAGTCTCNEGLKKLEGKSYECSKINCPASVSEHNVYCKSQCDNTCANGKCNEKGVCICDKSFVSVNWTMRVNCHHECNEDGSCPLAAILGGIVGVGSVIVIAIIVTAALLIRKRNRKEREEREQGDTQNIPLETLHEEPEYINHEQEEEMEENVMYRSVDWHANRHRVH